MSKRVLFFIDSLRSGGQERRFVELLHYLKLFTDYQMQIVLTENEIHFTDVYNLEIPITIIKRRWVKKDPSIFFRFYKIVKRFNPDIIHTWGAEGMTTFYAIPTKLILKKPLLSNLIADVKPLFKRSFFARIVFNANCHFSDKILGNSEAGFSAYGIKGNKKKVIYNGVRLERFNIQINKNEKRSEIKVTTTYMVIMVASISEYKDYDLFLDVAKRMNEIRKDVTFVGVGGGLNYEKIQNRILNEVIYNVVLTGERNDIESIVAVADVVVLFTKHSEGISNSIIESMALGKPVITTDISGGSSELMIDRETGYIMESNPSLLVDKINLLLNDENLRTSMGEKGKNIIRTRFPIDRMGEEFIELYDTFS